MYACCDGITHSHTIAAIERTSYSALQRLDIHESALHNVVSHDTGVSLEDIRSSMQQDAQLCSAVTLTVLQAYGDKLEVIVIG